MATDPRSIERLLNCLQNAGEVAAKPMIGEYGIYCNARFIGVVCDDQFHLKATQQGLALAPDLALEPAYPGAKPRMVVPAERWDDSDWITDLMRITAENLPPPLKRKR